MPGAERVCLRSGHPAVELEDGIGMADTRLFDERAADRARSARLS